MDKKGFIAGVFGAGIIIVLMLLFTLFGWIGNPPFVGTYRAFFAPHTLDYVPAILLFALSGGIWGYFYGLLFKPSIQSGILYGIAPTMWTWTAVPYALGKPLFAGLVLKGLVLPIIFNMLIWGTFVGWYLTKEKQRKRKKK